MLTHEKRPIQWLRRIIQAIFVAFIVFVGLRHQYGSGGSPIDAYCPLGGVESLYSLLTQGKMLAKTAYSNLILLGILLITTLLAGGFFCGWICPLGTIQDWIYAFRKKFVKKTMILPQMLDHYLRYLKYGVLILILIMTIRGMELWFADYDPFKVLFHFSFESTTAYVVLGLTVLTSLLIERFWCKYLCPLGALLTPLAKIGLIKPKKTEQCVDCNLCMRSCTMGLKEIGESGCTNCLECVSVCPAKGALEIHSGMKKPLRAPYILPTVTILLAAVLVAGSMNAGLWQTRTSMSATAVSTSGEVSTENSNYPPVEAITGMTYLDEVGKTYELSPEKILERAKLDPDQDPHQTVRDVTKKVGLEVEVIREAVRELLLEK